MFKQVCATALVSLAVASTAHAGEVEGYSGLAADAVTTSIALSMPGIAEANPLGWATVPIRLAIMQHAKTLPREQAQPLMDSVSASGWGAAANNLAVLAGAGPAGAILGIAVGYAVWKSGEKEREFWTACAMHKSIDPAVNCEFKTWRAEDLTRIAQEMNAANQVVAQAAPTVAGQ